MKLFIYILLFLSAYTTMQAQRISDDNISRMEFYFQKNDMDSAAKYINLAIAEDAYKNDPKTWFYKAQIYKELYKLKEKELLVSEYRNTATASIVKFYTLEANESFKPNVESLIKYLSATYYNDAAKALAIPDVALAKTNFDYYKQLTDIYSVDTKAVLQNEIQFKLALAHAIVPINEDTKLDSLQKVTLAFIFQEIITLDSNNGSANYNLSLIYYNEAVDIANNIDYDADFNTLLKVQDNIEQLFSKALPYMMKAYQADYKKEDTLLGLKNIYLGLNDEEKSAYYENELQSIKK